MRRKRLSAVTILCAAFLFIASAADAQDDYKYDARGFSANRDTFNQFPWEHIDPLTGNLLLTFIDLKLPGNAGFDLEITRTYNSKEYHWYPAGVGWTMHFGRVFHTPTIAPTLENPTPPPPTWVIEWRDGSQHECYWTGGTPGVPGPCVTQDLWSYDPNLRILYLPNGQIYRFDFVGGGGDVANPDLDHYATQIRDPFGNSIDITYNGRVEWPGPGISQIVQHVGDQTRTIGFSYDGTGSLATMTAFGKIWTYTQSADSTYRTLDAMVPPAGGSWRFGYSGRRLTSVDTPLGGHIDYSYDTRAVQDPVDPRGTISAEVVSQRTASDRGVAAGTWRFTYSTSGPDGTTVSGPDDISTAYTYTGWPLSGGLLLSVTRSQGGREVQREELTWAQEAPLGQDHNNVSVGLPLVSQRKVSRGSKNFTTIYTYNDSQFNDFGHPRQIDESGDFNRTTTRTYRHDFAAYVRGLVATEEVTAPGSTTYETRYQYDNATGFQTQLTKFGVTTAFVPDARGNVSTATDAEGRATHYTYDWGVVNRIEKPETTVTRTINQDGTVASETKGPTTTGFRYDDIGRLALTTPQIGNTTQTTYADASGTRTVQRGASTVTTTFDGFGRPTSTLNSVGIQKWIEYDAYGRPTRESHPFDDPATIPWTVRTYDALGRTTTRTNPDSSQAHNTYTGLDVTVTDENGHNMTQHWVAGGDPADARLAAVTADPGKQWTYSYNTLGELIEVAPPDGAPHRSWSYDARNFLTSVAHPESGTVELTYTAAGDVRTKRDANGVLFTYAYDGNHRLRQIDGAGRVTTYTYEPGTDNRASASNGDVATSFSYDAAGRLIERDDAIAGMAFSTALGYDANDNLTTITYPDGREVTYGYDSENRVTAITGPNGRTYAAGISWHASGAVTAYNTPNGIQHRMTYDQQRYWPRSINAGDFHLGYTDYDSVGNVRAIADDRPPSAQPFGSQTFSYDTVDRLRTANGPYGSITYDYDAHGNRVGADYEYEIGTMRLARFGTSTFSYDRNGNLFSAPNSIYTYTPQNMLETATVGTAHATYGYDADNWRSVKAVDGDVTSYFLRGPGGELLTEWQDPGGAANKTRDYIYLKSRLVAVVEKSGS